MPSLGGAVNLGVGGVLAALGFGRLYHRVAAAPGRGVHQELHARYAAARSLPERLRRFLFYRLGLAYKYYVDRSLDHSRSNEDYQRAYWSTYTEYYATKAVENYDTPFYGAFDRLFARAVTERKVRTCLDIGCGGFDQIARLRSKFPGLCFVGNDISEHSRRVHAARFRAAADITFVPGSVLQHMHVLSEIDLFYTFGVLMSLTGPELEEFLTGVRKAGRPVAGVIVEPITVSAQAPTVMRERHYLHDYRSYLPRFDLEIVEQEVREHYAMAGQPMQFAYFVNRG
jgi:hypothetical protein